MSTIHIPACAHCCAPITQPPAAGRPRIYCSARCRTAAWRARLLREEFEAAEVAPAETIVPGVPAAPVSTDEQVAFLAEPTEGLTDPDEVPDLPEEPVCKPGDLYLLGKHRLLCGDAANADDVQRLMAGKRASLMATDPPYLVDYQGGQHPSSEANGGIVDGVRVGHEEKHWDTYVDHEHSVEFYVDFLRTALDHALSDHAAIYQARPWLSGWLSCRHGRLPRRSAHASLIYTSACRQDRPENVRCTSLMTTCEDNYLDVDGLARRIDRIAESGHTAIVIWAGSRPCRIRAARPGGDLRVSRVR
jgi:hypothetical protein